MQPQGSSYVKGCRKVRVREGDVMMKTDGGGRRSTRERERGGGVGVEEEGKARGKERETWRYYAAGFEDGERNHESKNVGSLEKLVQANGFLPRASKGDTALPTRRLYLSKTPFQTSDLHNLKRINMCCFNKPVNL